MTGGTSGSGLGILAGTAGRHIARATAVRLGADLVGCDIERFPDGEIRPVVGTVRGTDVFVVQPTGPPGNDHILELLLLVDACRRAGAARITAVVPYFGYARQDRRDRPGEPIGTRVVTDALAAAGADRLLTVDPHTPALEATSTVPAETVTAVPTLAAVLAGLAGPEPVVVAPDLGAAKLAERYAAVLGAPVAVVRKHRMTGAAVESGEMAGDVRDRRAVVVDDMISTGGTIEAAVRLVQARGSAPGVLVAATHGLFVGDCRERLAHLALQGLVVTDSVVPSWEAPELQVCPLAPLLAGAVERMHDGRAPSGSDPTGGG